MGHFCHPGSGFGVLIRIHWPDRIRIQLGSGSATLIVTPSRIAGASRRSRPRPRWTGSRWGWSWRRWTRRTRTSSAAPPLGPSTVRPRGEEEEGWTFFFFFHYILSPSVLRIRIRDPVPFWSRDPGWVESQHPDPGSGMNNPDHIF